MAMIAASGVLIWAVLSTHWAKATPRAQDPPNARRTTTAPLPSAPLSLGNAPVQGGPPAKVGVLEYADFECPFCSRFAVTTYPTIAKSYIATGKIQFAFRYLPLEQRHASALRAAEAAECSHRQGRFWAMHDALFIMPSALDSDGLSAKARKIGLDSDQFRRCMNGEATARVREDLAEARLLGITGTPTFLFGTIGPDGRLKVQRRESGAMPAEVFASIVDELLPVR
jgi:protein-disulfide isomerase